MTTTSMLSLVNIYLCSKLHKGTIRTKSVDRSCKLENSRTRQGSIKMPGRKCIKPLLIQKGIQLGEHLEYSHLAARSDCRQTLQCQ
mmetsp:Transcript_8214/g.20210  ORF Transcript_8214/g.20210 Transcript_8214/m.20210 type:complete len:86 (-) Transcript_8214:1248-1505(-)